MDLSTAVENTVRSTAEDVFQPRGLFRRRPNINISGVTLLWSDKAPSDGYLNEYEARSNPSNNFGAIAHAAMSRFNSDVLRRCWETGSDAEQNFGGGAIFSAVNCIAIQRQGVVVSIASTGHSIQELKLIAEQYCQKVLTLIKN